MGNGEKSTKNDKKQQRNKLYVTGKIVLGYLFMV